MRLLLPLLLLPLAAPAQTAPARHATLLDLTAASGPSLNAASVAGWRLWGLGQTGRVQVGAGLRASCFWAQSLALDWQSGYFEGYTLTVEQPRTVAFNAALAARVWVAGPLHLGTNLDVVGLSVGPAQYSVLQSPNSLPAPVGSRPEPLNLLLGGSRDRGTLNSEFYASLALPHRVGVRAGFAHVVTGQESGDSRFRRFRNLALLGVSYELGQ